MILIFLNIIQEYMDKILRKKRYFILFVARALILYIIFGLLPIFYNLYLSLFQTNLMEVKNFVGLNNYKQLFQDHFFIKALGNNLKFVCGCYVAHMGFALILAQILTQNIVKSRLFQCVYFMPSVICGTAIGLLWKFNYNPEFGLLNSLLEFLGLEHWIHNWLADENTVIPALIVVTMWQFVGYHMLIQIAAMREVDGNLYEAAKIDGGTEWQKFRCITFPLIKPVLAIDSILIISGSLKLYDLIAVTTMGGPNHASEVLTTYMYYTGFKTQNFRYSSTISVQLLVLCLIAAALVKMVYRRKRGLEE